MQNKHFFTKYTIAGFNKAAAPKSAKNGLNKAAALLLTFVLSMGAGFSGCGPAEEKIEEARQTYRKVAEANDAVVEAHKLISDPSYDAELQALQQKAKEFETINMYEMEEEEIDALMKDMQEIIASYEEYLTTMQEVKAAEEAAVLVTIPVSIKNLSSLSFTSLSLAEQGASTGAELLTDLSAFGHGQDVRGLYIRRDVDNTPWILKLANAEGQAYELTLPVETYTEAGVVLALSYDAETDTLSIGEYEVPEKPADTDAEEVPTGEAAAEEDADAAGADANEEGADTAAAEDPAEDTASEENT